jgi:hypothetical protein
MSRLALAVASIALLAGCTAAPVSTSSPRPTAAGEWDLTLVRDFPDESGSLVSCTLLKRALRDGNSVGAEIDQRLADAAAFLAEGDWSTVQLPEPALQAGLSLPARRAMALQEVILDDLRDAGLTGEGVSVESRTDCDS